MANKKALRAKELYSQGMLLKDIAATLGVKEGTVRSWKNRHQWEADATTATQRACNVAVQQDAAPRARLDVAAVAAALAVGDVEGNAALKDWEKTFCLHYSRTYNATQAYLRAKPNVTYNTAGAKGPVLAHDPRIRAEVERLRVLKNLEMLATGDDVVEKMMHIAFADMTDYVRWGVDTVDTGEVNEDGEPVTRRYSYVELIDSDRVDGTLINEVKQGRDGLSVKRADSIAALKWLGDYFELNPKDRHRRDFDEKRLAMEERKLGLAGSEGMGDVVIEIVAPEVEGEDADSDEQGVHTVPEE